MIDPFDLDAAVAPELSWQHRNGFSHLLRKGNTIPVARIVHPGSVSVFYMWWRVSVVAQPGALCETLAEAEQAAEQAYERSLQS